MKCPRCQQENPPQAKFCLECATPADGATSAPKSYADLKGENEKLRRALGEALEQQTATSEILRVISSSPTDIQAVLATVAERAARLCDSFDAAIFLVDGGTLRRVAHHGPIPPTGTTTPLARGFVNGRVVLERREIHLADLQAEADEFPEGSAEAQRLAWRTTLAVPLRTENTVIGTIAIRRTEVRPFSMQQIDLLKTFADQAVIAIENVRLFKELGARNRDLSATSEILHAISRSPTDEKPVFDSIVRSTIRLCDATFCVAYRYDGEQLHVAAHDKLTPETLALLDARYPQPPSRETATGVSILERRVVHIPDASADDLPPASREFARQQGWGSLLAVPLLRDGQPVGNIAVARVERQPFTEQQIALVQTFADQAVIAIENVRLFNELAGRNAELAETLLQQTATEEILRVLSRSPTDYQPVFDTIVRNASRVCGAADALLGTIQDDEFVIRAHDGSIFAPIRGTASNAGDSGGARSKPSASRPSQRPG
jgi:two-component system NtrC family sensor kinase